MTVCVNPTDLTVDDRGVLRVNVLSKPGSVEWPYDCDLATYNSFRRDIDCLWADPPPRTNLSAVTVDLPLNVSVSTTNVPVTNVASLTVINNDPCRAASALVTVTTRSTIEPILDDGEVVHYVLLHQVFGVSTPDAAFRQTWRDAAYSATTRVGGGQMVWNIASIAPGGSQVVSVDLAGRAATGTTGDGWLWTRALVWITALVIIP